jgi:peptidoglycan-associated lipoprotein
MSKVMYKKIFSFLVLITLVSGCETTDEVTRDAPRPANVDGGGVSDEVYTNQLPELIAGSQEDLVAHVGDRVFFDYDQADIGDNAQRTLQRQAEWLKMNPDVVATIEGHADERGTREYNIALGDRRANSVKNYLISLGIDSNRLTTISYGKEYPEDPAENEAAWKKNRRAVTVVTNR